MDAAQVTEKILADANAQAGEMSKQAQEKDASEQAKLDKQLAEYKSQTQILAQKAGEDKKARLLAAARMQIAKDYLAVKREILDGVFEQTKTQLRNLEDKDYRNLMTKLMLDAVETGDEEVIVDNQETRIDPGFIKNVNRELGTGYGGNLRLSQQTQNIGGGFILKRGRIKTNVSIQVLIEQARKDLEIELAKGLFES